MTSNLVNSYDKNIRVAVVAYTHQPVMSRGSNSDSLRTIGVAMAAMYPYPSCLGYVGIIHCCDVFDPLHSWYKNSYRSNLEHIYT